MKYSINFTYLTKELEAEKAAHMISKAGFKALDYTPPVKDDAWEKIMLKNMSIFEKENLCVHQTHAPFNRYGGYGDNLKQFLERAFEATERMNAKYMVVHGDEFNFENDDYSPEKALIYNYDLFAPIVERAAAKNINIAFENVFEDGGKDKPRFCSRVEDLKELIERFNSDNVCCCWDFGHAGVAFGEEQPEKIKYMGKHIKCTHVHDCGHNYDLHLPPFLGDINWKECMNAMSEINYSEILSFEFVYGKIPEELAETFLKSMTEVADCLSSYL